MEERKRHLSKEQIESSLLHEPATEMAELHKRFGKQISESNRLLYRVHQEVEECESAWADTERNKTIRLFLHVAYQSLFTAQFLLIRGLPVPAGNMMRQYAEATAMALLCFEEKSGAFEAYQKNRETYPYAKALELVMKRETAAALKKRIAFDADAWNGFVRISKFYNHHSHASIVAQGFAVRAGPSGGKVIGPDFDPAKVPMYRADFSRVQSAVKAFRTLLKGLHKVVERAPKGAG